MEDLLRRADVHVDAAVKPGTFAVVQQRVRDEFSSWGLTSNAYDKAIHCAAYIGSLVFYQSNVDVQVHIAVFTALLIAVDDLIVPREALEEFVPRLVKGSAQLHPVLDALMANMRDLVDYFPLCAARGIRTSVLNFINRNVFDLEQADRALSQGAMHYVRWARLKDGLGEAFAYFIWDKFQFPQTTGYIQALP